jgi:zinc protease
MHFDPDCGVRYRYLRPMIEYERFTLKNGLRVILHQDLTTPLVAINMLYDVGSRDEHPDKTGFAHLFEHLMFGGSDGAESFDDPIQNAGGECNAFTNSDVTNFFSILPADNLELGLYLEADRMHRLTLNEKTLNIQRSVVIEEFKETCLNQPYGEMWHNLAPLAYRQHAYKWPTIGMEISHIDQASIDDVGSFYQSYYGPNNAICVIAGNFERDLLFAMLEKHFGSIPDRPRPIRDLEREPEQTESRKRTHHSNIPVDTLYMAFHMPGRTDENYYPSDLLSDIMASGKSARIYQTLVRQLQLCTEADVYITGTIDPGLIIVEAKPSNGHTLKEIETAVWDLLDELITEKISDRELEKHKNKIESSICFSNISILNKAMNLAFYELIGEPELINTEQEKYQGITADSIQQAARVIFLKENCSTLYYRKAVG